MDRHRVAAPPRSGAAQCPLQPGQPCTLCHAAAKTGPQDCPTVALVMDDADLRAEASRLRARYRACLKDG